MVEMQRHIGVVVVADRLVELVLVPPPVQVVFFPFFQDNFPAHLALGGVPVALNCVSSCFFHRHELLAVRAKQLFIFLGHQILLILAALFLRVGVLHLDFAELHLLREVLVSLRRSKLSKPSRAFHACLGVELRATGSC